MRVQTLQDVSSASSSDLFGASRGLHDRSSSRAFSAGMTCVSMRASGRTGSFERLKNCSSLPTTRSFVSSSTFSFRSKKLWLDKCIPFEGDTFFVKRAGFVFELRSCLALQGVFVLGLRNKNNAAWLKQMRFCCWHYVVFLCLSFGHASLLQRIWCCGLQARPRRWNRRSGASQSESAPFDMGDVACVATFQSAFVGARIALTRRDCLMMFFEETGESKALTFSRQDASVSALFSASAPLRTALATDPTRFLPMAQSGWESLMCFSKILFDPKWSRCACTARRKLLVGGHGLRVEGCGWHRNKT